MLYFFMGMGDLDLCFYVIKYIYWLRQQDTCIIVLFYHEIRIDDKDM